MSTVSPFMYEIVNQYSGEGRFHFVSSKEILLDLGFVITQYSDAKIEIVCSLLYMKPETLSSIADLFNMNKEDEINIFMDGRVHTPNGKIKVEEAFITDFHFDFKPTRLSFRLILRAFKPVEIIFKEIESQDIRACAGLTNFLFKACNTTEDKFYGFKVNLGDFSVGFKHNESYDANKKLLENLEETILVTSEAVIDFDNTDLNFTEIITNLSNLLSYACRTRISPIYENYYSKDDIFKTVLRPVITKEFDKGDNLVNSDIFGNCDLKYYLEICYAKYLEFMNKFALNIVISFYLEAITNDYIDMAFLLCSTTLETILNGYEEFRKEEGNPITLGLIKRNKKKIIKVLNEEGILISEEKAEKVAEEVSYKNLNLQEKLSAFIKDPRFLVELDEYDRDFSLIRNKIVHTGKFPEKIKSNGKERTISLQKEFNRLIYLVDRIILTILDYKEKPFLNKLDGSITVLKK